MKNKKIVIVILIFIIIVAIIILGRKDDNNDKNEIIETGSEEVDLQQYIEEGENGILKNDSEALKQDKKLDSLKISNIRINGKQDEISTIMMDIENMSNQVQGDKKVVFIMKDRENKEIGKIYSYIEKIEAKQKISIEIETEFAFINTYDFEIIDEELEME